MNNRFIYILLIILLPFALFAQDKKKDKRKKVLGTQTSFGIQLSPIIPTNLLQTNDVIKTTDTSMYSVSIQKQLEEIADGSRFPEILAAPLARPFAFRFLFVPQPALGFPGTAPVSHQYHAFPAGDSSAHFR